jgi:(E)-4-hydroxy-3-methylbut-2-enyl-diphosphate synthase
VGKIRINPGNIGAPEKVKAVAEACLKRNIPIRIGVNGGSLEKHLLEKYGGVTAEAMLESALGHVALLNRYDFDDICISVKSSSVPLTIAAYRLLSKETDYPLHLGVTEAGTEYAGVIRSAVGIGSLLCDGIGDTIRVSLTDAPEEEVRAGTELLRALGLWKGVQFISCPTCGRTEYDLIGTARQVEERLRDKPWDITVAVMGCVVNGPGEASHADYGIAGGKNEGVLFRRGEPLRRVASNRLADELVELIESENH